MALLTGDDNEKLGEENHQEERDEQRLRLVVVLQGHERCFDHKTLDVPGLY